MGSCNCWDGEPRLCAFLYLLITLMFSSTKSQEWFKTNFYSSFLRARFNALQHVMRYTDATKPAGSQTLASTRTCIPRVQNVFNAEHNYEQTLSSVIHHISNVSLPQENVTPWYDLPKQNTFSSNLFSLVHTNSQTTTTSSLHNDANQFRRLKFSLFQHTNTTDYYWY
jgi:hypothetical protein